MDGGVNACILICFRAEQLSKAYFSIDVIPGGRVISSSDMQKRNAPIPIDVTLSGILI